MSGQHVGVRQSLERAQQSKAWIIAKIQNAACGQPDYPRNWRCKGKGQAVLRSETGWERRGTEQELRAGGPVTSSHSAHAPCMRLWACVGGPVCAHPAHVLRAFLSIGQGPEAPSGPLGRAGTSGEQRPLVVVRHGWAFHAPGTQPDRPHSRLPG